MAAGRLLGTLQAAMGLRSNAGRALVARDLQVFLRMECLGALTRSGLIDGLVAGGTASDLAARVGLTDVDLTAALLDVGVAHRLVRRSGDGYRARGPRMRAVSGDRAPDVSGLAEEATAYDGPIYAAMHRHLRGLPPQPYDAELGDVIARASRVAEPVVGPWIAAEAARVRPATVLDVGCGSGVNLRVLANALPGAVLWGIDLDADAAAGAAANVGSWGLSERVEVRQADLNQLPDDLSGPWGLILLAQNIYYWPVEDRPDLLRRLRVLSGGDGTVLLATAVPSRSAVGRHLDLALRVTQGCHRLPTRQELEADARAAGFTSVRVRDLVPGVGMAAVVASG